MKYWLVALQLLIVSPVSAHCYSIWRYPWKQNCRVVTTYVPRKPVGNLNIYPPDNNPVRDIDIPIPNLTGVWISPMDTPEQLELVQGMQRLKALRLLTEN